MVVLTSTGSSTPIRVTAYLRGGAVLDEPHGLDLAGILAGRVRRVAQDRAGRGTGAAVPVDATGDPDDLALPLARCLRPGENWHWLASCAQPLDADPDPDPRTAHRMVDWGWAHRAARRPLPAVTPRKGPYRDMLVPVAVTVCRALRWWAVGDPDAVNTLLQPVTGVGRRRNTGEGRVLQWTVETAPETDPEEWGHLGERGELARPVPACCADALGVAWRPGYYAVRPPSWSPHRLIKVAMPL